MQRILVHIAVALVAFTVGVSAASILGSVFGTRTLRQSERSVYVAPPMPAEHPSCPSKRFKEMHAPPIAPMPPSAPAAPKESKKTRIRIHMPDGTVRVIEQETVESAERKF